MPEVIIKSVLGYDNWGDSINPFFISLISGIKPRVLSIFEHPDKENFLIIGSILRHADDKTVVWGAGFIEQDAICSVVPKKILAVRGPLTRQKLLDQGIECPEVFGDPILLLPRFYFPQVNKKYKLGIIPHEIDQDSEWLKNVNDPNVKIINIKQYGLGFVDEVLECEKIASSSLHGLIVADAYGIPSTWLEFSDKVIGKGFKFLDYFASVGRKDKKPLRITAKTKLSDIMNSFSDYKIKIDLDKLWDARPKFIK